MAVDSEPLRHLLGVGRRLLAELDPEVVFSLLLAEAREMTGARYAALGILSDDRSRLARFITDGIGNRQRLAIGAPPRGRGVLGVLIERPLPLRIADIGSHPQSYGFPIGHPEMSSFLGVPILIRDRAWGNLYLTNKTGGGKFTDEDEESVVTMAEFAATAIENARLYQGAEGGRRELSQAVRGLEAAKAIADAIAAGMDLDAILELIVKRGRALVGARSVMIMLCEGEQLILAAGTGIRGDRRGTRVDLAGSFSEAALLSGKPQRIHTGPTELRETRERLGSADVRNTLLMPMIHQGRGLGVLVVQDPGAEQPSFSDADEKLMGTFASSAANAVAISRSVEENRLRATIEAAEEERRRWARELHDQTLQSLGGLRIMLSRARRKGELDVFDETVGQAIEDLEFEIQNLRGIISDLRPPLLDDLGLADALGALIDRHRSSGLQAELSLDLKQLTAQGLTLSPQLETTVYRLTQEALTNVVKHAKAQQVRVAVAVSEARILTLEVVDDGVGFDTTTPKAGFGLGSLRERVYLAGGSIHLDSSPDGTAMQAQIPLPS